MLISVSSDIVSFIKLTIIELKYYIIFIYAIDENQQATVYIFNYLYFFFILPITRATTFISYLYYIY